MEASEVLAFGLNVIPPWRLVDQRLDTEKNPNELHIEVTADQHGLYPCPECGKTRQVRETVTMIWRHEDFFHFPCYVTAHVPKIDCPDHGMMQVLVPWVRPGSQLSVSQLARAREPSRTQASINRVLNAGQMGMGGDSCTKEENKH